MEDVQSNSQRQKVVFRLTQSLFRPGLVKHFRYKVYFVWSLFMEKDVSGVVHDSHYCLTFWFVYN